MTSRRKQQQQHLNDLSNDSFDEEYERLIASSQQQRRRSPNSSTRRNGSNTSDGTRTTAIVGNDISILTHTQLRSRTPSADSMEIAELNLDHLTSQKVEVITIAASDSSDRYYTYHQRNGNGASSPVGSSSSTTTATTKRKGKKKKKFYKTYYGRTVSISEYCSSHISMLCYYYPITCGCMVFVAIVLFLTYLLMLTMYNPMQEFGIMHNDHSNIPSMYDVEMGKIDHWCLGGGNTDCTCEDPTVPIARSEYASWVEAFRSNRKLVKQYENNVALGGNNLDVAFIGESVVEEMDGRWMGQRSKLVSNNYVRSQLLSDLEQTFNRNFHTKQYHNATSSSSFELEGVALGIAGDTAPNVLFRLLHGEMPDYFTPKVWWILLGNNDLGRTGCSEEVVVIGILRIVEEILTKRPNARVVINSLLPMTVSRGGMYPVISDYEDSLISSGRGYRRRLRLKKKQKGKETESPIPNDDATLVTAAEEEERVRDAKARQKQRYKHPTQQNPIMSDEVVKMHKYKVGVPLIQRNEKPLWTSIRAINKEIKKFANKNQRVYYFDATEVFAKKIGSNAHELQTDLISERGHPTLQGFELWEDAIRVKLEEILSTMKQENPELFKPATTSWSSGVDVSNSPNNKRKYQKENYTDDVVGNQDDDLDEEIFANDDYRLSHIKGETNNNNGNILVDPVNNDDDATEGNLIVRPTKSNDDGNYK